MQPSRQIFIAFFLLALGVTPLVGGDDAKSSSQSSDNAEQKRKMLEAKAKSDPEWYAQTVRELNAFLAMSPDRREQMRKLDQELHRKDAATHQRLVRVLERYVRWLEHLPENQRKYIEQAPNSQERLRRIKEIRENEWIQTLPKAVREEIHQSKGKEREALIQKYRERERQRRKEWQAGERARPKNQPASDTKLPDVPDKVLWDFAKNELTPQDRKRLNLTFTDPAARERLKEEYFKKHPEELEKLREKKKNLKNKPAEKN
jgi:hypothetical protein